MKKIKILIAVSFLLTSFSGTAFELADLSDVLFKDTATGVKGQLKDAKFEFDAYSTILLDKGLSKNVHILVARNRSSVLIAGQARTKQLREKVQRLVLGVAHVKWKEGDVNDVEPANAQVCGKGASKVSGNERRKFNLKSADECSTVNRIYNEVIVGIPLDEKQQSDDDLLRAKIVNELLYASIIENADTVKIVVTSGVVYLLGDQLAKETAEQVTKFVKDLTDVKKVIPLFRF